MRWIETTRGQQPFFAYIATNAPHGPLEVRPDDEARYAGKVKNADVAKFFGMIANIDDNVGRLLVKLNEWKIERETLVIFMNDNGGTVGTQVFNAGMRGQKASPWLGGTRASSFWRWPGTLNPADVKISHGPSHDFFPTLAEIAGVPLSDDLQKQVEGRSLVPLLKNPQVEWPSRILITHVGRWPKGEQQEFKFANCSVRTPRWHLVCDGEKARSYQFSAGRTFRSGCRPSSASNQTSQPIMPTSLRSSARLTRSGGIRSSHFSSTKTFRFPRKTRSSGFTVNNSGTSKHNG